jgi:hypothetical protein
VTEGWPSPIGIKVLGRVAEVGPVDVITWDEVDEAVGTDAVRATDAVRNFRDQFVDAFFRYRGMSVDEGDHQAVISQRSFCKRYGLNHTTFHDWLDARSKPKDKAGKELYRAWYEGRSDTDHTQPQLRTITQVRNALNLVRGVLLDEDPDPRLAKRAGERLRHAVGEAAKLATQLDGADLDPCTSCGGTGVAANRRLVEA